MAEKVEFKQLLEDDVLFSASRSSGPGGQNVNKRSTKAELTFYIRRTRWLTEFQKTRIVSFLQEHRPSTLYGEKDDEYIIVTSSTSRSLESNKLSAELKLKGLIERCLFQAPPRKKTKPTKGSIEKRLQSKKKDSLKKSLRRIPRD